MANLWKIKDLMNEKKITYEVLSSKTGISVSGIFKLIKNNSGTTDNVEAIAKALGVRVGVFFDDDNEITTEGGETISIPKEVMDMLKQKDERIEQLTNALLRSAN